MVGCPFTAWEISTVNLAVTVPTGLPANPEVIVADKWVKPLNN